MSVIAPALEAFFTDRLITQRNCSPQTIGSYRDTFRLLLCFAQRQTGKQPCELDFDDLDATLVGAFLTHLEEAAATPPGPATSAWQRSTRSTVTPRSNIQSTPRRSPG